MRTSNLPERAAPRRRLAPSLAVLLLLSPLLAACRATTPGPAPLPSEAPRVLLLGDSISIGYTPFVVEALADEAVVVRPRRADGGAENCQGTTYGAQHVERWLELEGGAWDVVHLNFGLHDLKHVDPATGRNSERAEDPPQADLATYARQLRAITAACAASGARLVLATTTPVPEGGVRPYRDPADVQRYNAVLLQVAAEYGADVDDLFGLALARLGELQRPGDVHFTEDGSRVLARQVVDSVRAAAAR